jgi:hypothetical protein
MQTPSLLTRRDKLHQNSAADAEEVGRRERALDDALKDSFPASDPPAAVAPHSQER